MSAEDVKGAARKYLAQFPDIDVEYMELRDGRLGKLEESNDTGVVECRLLLAARVGTTRLIDNMGIMLQR